MNTPLLKLSRCAAKICILGVFTAISTSGALHADEISLDLGGGVKMEFVWVPVEGTDGRASVKIGDQTGAHEKEPMKPETIYTIGLIATDPVFQKPPTSDNAKFGR